MDEERQLEIKELDQKLEINKKKMEEYFKNKKCPTYIMEVNGEIQWNSVFKAEGASSFTNIICQLTGVSDFELARSIFNKCIKCTTR